MRRSTRRKLKVYAVDAAMILLAAQVTIVLKADNKAEASTYTAIQAAQDEYIETRSDTEAPERDAEYISISEDEQNWSRKDSDILLRIAMAEAEGEGTEGKALVMNVILNRVESEEFPDSIEAVVFQPGQFEPVLDDGRYWDVEPDAECYKALYWSNMKTGTIRKVRYISAELVVHLGWRTIQNIFLLWEIIPFIDRRQECWNDGL